ncbi:MAG: hypothetical protein HYX90_01080 [Chloroflexi bacterium]|nr:hypothetical protein [Chloroflexota bacterium]
MDKEETKQAPEAEGTPAPEALAGETATVAPAAAEKDPEVAAARKELADTQIRLGQLQEALGKAVASYKMVVIESNPTLPADLIVGNTVDEVDASVKNARAIVQRVRQQIEVEASKTQVPAGAPQRVGIDASGLSAREKIQQAIGGKR